MFGVASADFEVDIKAVQGHSHQGWLVNFAQGCLLLSPHCEAPNMSVKFNDLTSCLITALSALVFFTEAFSFEPFQRSTHASHFKPQRLQSGLVDTSCPTPPELFHDFVNSHWNQQVMLKQKTWSSSCLLLGFYFPPIKFVSEKKNPEILVGYLETEDRNGDTQHMALFSLSAQLLNPRENTLGFFTPRMGRGHLNSWELLSSGRLVGSEPSLSGSSPSSYPAPELLSSDLAVTFPVCGRHLVFPPQSAGAGVNMVGSSWVGRLMLSILLTPGVFRCRHGH